MLVPQLRRGRPQRSHQQRRPGQQDHRAEGDQLQGVHRATTWPVGGS